MTNILQIGCVRMSVGRLYFEDFGDRNSAFGWEIDHIYPASKLKERKDVTDEQIDDMRNLRPLNWRNNASKGADYPF